MMLWVLDLSDDALLDAVEQTQRLLAEARLSTLPSEEARHIRTIRAGTKCDTPQALDRLAILREMSGDVSILAVSAETGVGLDELKQAIFRELSIIRVYTKRPGKPADMEDPVILARGSTVMDAAYHLHKDIAAGLTYARLWNESGYDGQRVERGHVVQDKDILEFHV